MVKSSYRYDAFISYSHEDEKWARGILLPTLETNGIKVIIDYRDFEPGAPSITEMERAIKESQKTIIVLTNNYIKSAWTEFESLLLSTLDPAARNRQLLPVLKEKIDLPTRIAYLTYVDFTNTEMENQSWINLIHVFNKTPKMPMPSIPKNTQMLTGENKLSSLSSKTVGQLRNFLLECDELSSNSRLKALFAADRLSIFRTSVPEARDPSERVDLLIELLLRRGFSDGQSLLIVFLNVLKTRLSETDIRYNQLTEIITKINNEFGQLIDDKEKKTLDSTEKFKPILIWVNRNFKDFDNKQLDALIDEIAKLLTISRSDIKVLKVTEGSVLLTLVMPEEAAATLIGMYLDKAPAIESLNIYRVELNHEPSPFVTTVFEEEKNLGLLQAYKSNLLKVEERIAKFVDPRSVPLDLEVTKTEIIKKINELEKTYGTPPRNQPRDMNSTRVVDLMSRIDALETNLSSKLDDLKRGQAYIYKNIRPADTELLKNIFEEVHRGRIEQGELQNSVDATRRALKYILDKGVKISDPEITKSLAEIYQSVNSSLNFEQQFELTLPVIPFLLNYKVDLGGRVDLRAVWKELADRFSK